MSQLQTTEAAPAKVNLTLHVTGQRDDGYHLLDSLVVFVDVADRLTVRLADETALAVTGPMSAGVPSDPRNLVWKAAELAGLRAEITLEKHLPAAAGIGGGSSDAAAMLRAARSLTGHGFPDPAAVLSLGADVPVCLEPKALRMRGIGEVIDPVPELPPLCLVLANPGVEVPTPAVFKALTTKSNPPMPPALPPWSDAIDFCHWLGQQRNDLEPPARSISPEIARVIDALAVTDGCLLARMSGSGATCFGMFEDEAAANSAQASIAARFPTWWCASGAVL
ncbi:MAG: 4-(cytidine 5'-diphospho)-2-C-methyl-D-erythritol kinase [Pseudomonadota bacterium]